MFDRSLSQPVLSDLGILFAAGVHFDVSGPVLYPGGDSVRAGPRLLVSGDTSDGDGLPMTMVTRPLTGGFMCCGWLKFVTRGAGCRRRGAGGGACGSSNQHTSVHHRAQSWRLGDMYLDCAHSAGIS